MRTLIVVILSAVLLTVSIVSAQQRPISIRYFGQSFFVVTSADGLRIVIDPFSNIGYAMPTVEADVVLVTHEHGDHNNVGLTRGNPRVFRGKPNVRRLGSHTLGLTGEQLPATTQVIVMDYQ